MGCDIHFYVEKFDGEKWVSADKWTPDKYAEDGSLTVDYDDRFYRGRNYDLFAILADVRNGRGFAGVDTGDGFKPIAMPKGLPADVSPQVKRESDGWGIDGHSHSYFTLAELQAYNWTGQTTRHRGVVDSEEYRVFKEKGKPESWSGGVSGSQVTHVSNAEMDTLIKFNRAHGCYTQIEWEEVYADSVSRFLDETMPKLRDLAEGNPDSVRIVFWFDN